MKKSNILLIELTLELEKYYKKLKILLPHIFHFDTVKVRIPIGVI